MKTSIQSARFRHLALLCSAMVVQFSVQRTDATSVPAIDLNPMTQLWNESPPTPPEMYFGFDEWMLATNGMYGWSFVLSQPMTVTELAWFDQDLDGLSHDHQIGIWQWTNGYALLVSATILAGTNAELDGVWRKVDLGDPIALPAGNFVIAGTHYSQNPDVVKFVFGGNLPRDPRIVIGNPAFSEENPTMFRVPDTFITVPAGVELGPNLFVIPVSNPIEPPALQIARSGSQIILFWPAWATNFVVETSGDLGASANWITVTNAAEASNGIIVQTNTVDATAAFFRLRGR